MSASAVRNAVGKRVSWFSQGGGSDENLPGSSRSSSKNLFLGQARYGWGRISPQWLQCLATPVGALAFLCLQPLIQGFIVNGALRIGLTHIEKRFGLTSFEAGFIGAAFDLACFFFLVPVTFFGGSKNANRAHWVGYGTIILGFGSIIFSLPAFLTPPYYPGKSDLCSNQYPDNEQTETFFLMFVIMSVGNFIHGVGATPLLTLAVSYIDDYVERSKASIFLGTLQAPFV